MLAYVSCGDMEIPFQMVLWKKYSRKYFSDLFFIWDSLRCSHFSISQAWKGGFQSLKMIFQPIIIAVWIQYFIDCESANKPLQSTKALESRLLSNS